MKKKYIDKIRMGSGMSLMVGDKPSAMDISLIGVGKPNLEISKFGLFESSTPNFETYYPDIKNAADIKPDEGDFIKPIFRMLSEVIVRKSTNPVDFSKNGVLKASMNKLLGQTIYPNHDSVVGNELGAVSAVSWQPAYTAANGILVPAGINGEFKIDAKAHPNVARKIQMSPPAIHSNSVTVEFEWEISHPAMDMDTFRKNVGTYAADGELVRRIATLVRNYHETSLVSHGADPYAQVVDSKGKINNPDYADSVYSLAMQGKEKPTQYFFNYREDLISLNNNEQEDFQENNQDNNQNQTEMKKITLLASQIVLLGLFGAKPETGKDSVEVELTDDLLGKLEEKLKAGDTASTELAAANTKAGDLQTKLSAKETEVTGLTTQVTELNTKVTTLSDAGKATVDKLRSEAKRIYTALKAEQVDAAILANIETANPELLASLTKGYTEELEAKFPSTCNDCGSTHVSKASSKLGAEATAGKTADGKITLVSDQDVRASFTKEVANNKFILDK